MTKRPKRALLFWVRAVPRVSVVASIDRTRFAPWEAGFSVLILSLGHSLPRALANTSKRGQFWFHNWVSANPGRGGRVHSGTLPSKSGLEPIIGRNVSVA